MLIKCSANDSCACQCVFTDVLGNYSNIFKTEAIGCNSREMGFLAVIEEVNNVCIKDKDAAVTQNQVYIFAV